MRAGVEGESARGCLHAGAVGEHAGIFDGDDGIVRGDFADADRGAEGRGEAAGEGDYVVGGGEEEGGVSEGTRNKDNAEARRKPRFVEKKGNSLRRAQRQLREGWGEDSQKW